jgi:hypothetical protein
MRYVLVLAALVLPLAACGGGGGGSSSNGASLSPLASVKTAARKSSSAPSEHVVVKGTATVSGQPVLVSGSGDFDNVNHRGSVHSDVNAGGLSATLDAVMNGTVFYLRSPLFSATIPTGKTWLKLDLQKLGKAANLDFGALLSQDPSQAFAQVAASGSVVEVGDEKIDGVDTTHYRARVDPSKVPQGAKIQALTKAKYGPYHVWVGKDDGYVHRIQVSYSYSTNGVRQAVATTTTFSDFGKKVSVDVPTDADSYDATDTAVKGLGG